MYKLIFDHALIALQLAIVGHLQLNVLISLADLALLFILVLFWRTKFTTEADLTRRLFLFAPVCYS